MATLQKIRSQAGLLVGVVGLALFAFIIGDFLNSGSTFFNQRKETILTVDGRSIGIQDFQVRTTEMEEIYKIQSGNSSIPEDIHSQIRESAFESMIREILLREKSQKIGFTVTKEELKDLLMGDYISPLVQQLPMARNPQTGNFDKNALIQFLQLIESGEYDDNPNFQAQKTYWLFIEQTVKQQKMEEKFSNLVSKAIVTNSLDAKATFDANGGMNVDFDFVDQSFATIPDDQVTVSDAEIQKLYNKRKEQFKQDETVVISYIAVDIAPSQEDFAKVVETLNKVKPALETAVSATDIVNDYSDVPFADVFMSSSNMTIGIRNFVEGASVGSVSDLLLFNTTYHLVKLLDKTMAHDSIKINQIALPQLDDQAMTHLTDSLIDVINKGKTFSELATELTGGRSNGELGWMTEIDLLRASDEQFKKSVFNAPLNKVFIAKSTYGTHLVLVTEKTAPITKFKVADIQIDVTPSSDTYKDLYNNLAKYVSQNKTSDAFKSSAQEAGYLCHTEVPVGKNAQMIGSLRNVRPVIRWAFDQKKGAVSDNIFECQDKFVIVAVEGFQRDGYRPLASVSDMLKRELLNEKKGEKIVNDLKGKQFDSLEQYAEAMSSSIQSAQSVNFATHNIPGIGTEPVINVKAPLMEVGKISQPLRGNNAVYVLKVTKQQESEGKFDLQFQKQLSDMGNSYRFKHLVIQTLREKSKIVDERIRFY